MKYNDWDAYKSAHPDAAAVMEADHGFDFLSDMRDAVENGRFITQRMQDAIDRCVRTYEQKTGKAAERMDAAGVDRPERGETLEDLKVRIHKVGFSTEKDGLDWYILHYHDQQDRPGRAKTRDHELAQVAVGDHDLPELGDETKANGRATIGGRVVWAREHFAIIEVEWWEPSGIVRKRGVAAATPAARRRESEVGLKKKHRKKKAPPVEVAGAVVETDDWMSKLAF